MSTKRESEEQFKRIMKELSGKNPDKVGVRVFDIIDNTISELSRKENVPEPQWSFMYQQAPSTHSIATDEIYIDPVYREIMKLKPEWINDLKWTIAHEFKHYLQQREYGEEEMRKMNRTAKGYIKLEKEAEEFANSYITVPKEVQDDVERVWGLASELQIRKKLSPEVAAAIIIRRT